MAAIIQSIASEIADNWPAFLFIATTTFFSVCFLRERRAETRMLKELGEALQEGILARFDRLESIVRQSSANAALTEGAEIPPRMVANLPGRDDGQHCSQPRAGLPRGPARLARSG